MVKPFVRFCCSDRAISTWLPLLCVAVITYVAFWLLSALIDPQPTGFPTFTASVPSEHKKGSSCGPPLEPYYKDVVKNDDTRIFVDCGKESNPNSPFHGIAFELRNGSELWRVVDIGLLCCYRPFFRIDDNHNHVM